MNKIRFPLLGLLLSLTACAPLHRDGEVARARGKNASELLVPLQAKYAADPHTSIYKVTTELEGSGLLLEGEVDREEAKQETQRTLETAGFKVTNHIQVLPSSEFGEKGWGISCLSVASGRELPDHKAEMGTQVLMGHPARFLKTTAHWVYAQAPNGYLAWFEKETMAPVTEAQRKTWENGPLLIVTAFDAQVLEQPQPSAQPVTDVVTGNLLKLVKDEGDWFKVQLADDRTGFLPKTAAQDFASWKGSRSATAENIEKTARTFLGRPYLWGGNSPKGMDCSGFAGLVYYLNGITLKRNASEQAAQGELVSTDNDLAALRKGDLLFFGPGRRSEKQRWVTHVAIYLGDKTYIQSSERVRVSSLDPDAPNYDPFHGRSLLFARRIIPQTTIQQ
jgi:cell wall-associated NlpC family hydrolase